MLKRNHYICIISSLVLFYLIFQTFTPVRGLTETKTDPENDVYRILYEETMIVMGATPAPKISQIVEPPGNLDIKQGDYHDEVDIVKLEINGQNLNLTLAGNINDWVNDDNHSTRAFIFLYPDFNLEDFKQGIHPYPFYVASYQNQSVYGPGYKLLLFKDTDNETSYLWDGAGWTLTKILSANIGYASGKSIIANVPSGAYIIPDNVSYFAWAVHENYGGERVTYIDVAPNEYSLWSVPQSETIPSYNIFIVVGLLFGISMFIVRKHIKRK